MSFTLIFINLNHKNSENYNIVWVKFLSKSKILRLTHVVQERKTIDTILFGYMKLYNKLHSIVFCFQALLCQFENI